MVQPQTPSQKQPTILVVEDNADVQNVLRAQLKRLGFIAICKENAKTALEWLAENFPDLILLDVMLPDMNGFDIAVRIRKQHTPERLPIIMLSALGHNVEDRIRGLEAGANDFLAKPYSLDELKARIQMFLNMKEEVAHQQDLLARYVSGVMRQQVQLNPALMEQRTTQHGVVMFALLHGFDQIAYHPSDNLIDLLDDFFEAMVRVVDHHNGIVFDLVGSEILAVFNIPNPVPAPSKLAVESALEMQRMFKLLQAAWAKSGIAVSMGVGIHEGDLVLGSVGAAGAMRYTVMGNVVNLANRFLKQAEDGEVVISPEVYSQLEPFEDVAIQQAEVPIKGFDQPITIFKLHPF